MKKIEKSLSKINQYYSANAILRAAITTIPYVGGAIDVLISSHAQNILNRRIEAFITELQLQLSLIEESKIDTEFFNKEDGFDLIIRAFNYASQTRHQEKLRAYAQIIRGALIHRDYENEDPELYLKIVEELSVKEFQAAKLLYDLKNDKTVESHKIIDDAFVLSNLYPEFDKEYLVYTFLRLEKNGLLKEVTGMYFDYKGGSYEVTTLFEKLMIFITASSTN